MVKIKIKKRLPALQTPAGSGSPDALLPVPLQIDVDLDFDRELIVLMGKNGSGKTTLLRLIAGLDTPDEGLIKVGERTLYYSGCGIDVATEKRKVGFVCSRGALFPWLTVKGNILYGTGDKAGSKADDRWIGELVKELRLNALLDRHPVGLSAGEVQRVALGRALARRPDILLLDEPLSAVDTTLRPELRAFIKRLQKEWDLPVIMVTHDRAEAHTMADRTYTIDDGALTEGVAGAVPGAPTLVSY